VTGLMGELIDEIGLGKMEEKEHLLPNNHWPFSNNKLPWSTQFMETSEVLRIHGRSPSFVVSLADAHQVLCSLSV
jgi:hypothetical protein